LTEAALANRQCIVCPQFFAPRSDTARACSPRCAQRFVSAEKKRVAAETRARRLALKSLAELAKEAQAEVNRYVRLRDLRLGRGCITCGARPKQKRGGTMDAGHFRSVGSAPHLRFYLPQIAGQCTPCNRHAGGRALDFRRALVARRGALWVETLESSAGKAAYTADYLRRLKRVFAKRANRLEARLKAIAAE
jgi:hypothetical protein